MSHRSQTLPSSQTADTLARSLGWFSLGLGALELFGAKSLCRWMGTEQHETLIRAYGAREIATGIGILTSRDPTPWMWGRVAGDALDLATLAMAATEKRAHADRIAIAAAAVAGVTVLDVMCAESLGNQDEEEFHRSWDYSDRSGLPRSPEEMRGAASDFEIPRDMRAPKALRPFNRQNRQNRLPAPEASM